MENNFFDKAHKLVHEHDELTQLRNDLQIATTSLGVIFMVLGCCEIISKYSGV